MCGASKPNALTIDEMCKSTASDVNLQNVIKCLESGKWYSYTKCEELSDFEQIKSVLPYVTSRGVIMKEKNSQTT